MTRVKTAAELDAMRAGGQILASVLQHCKSLVVPGVSTQALADAAGRELHALGGKPVFLGYQGFPDIMCISVNDEVVHGIPRAEHVVQDGDIVSLDFGVAYGGMITDAAISCIAGTAKPADAKLVAHTETAMLAGIAVLKDGVKTGDIGAAVQVELDRFGYGIVRDLVGHGVGHEMHEDPNIPNYGRAGHGQKLAAGMTICIEPMATRGTHRVWLDRDGWTIHTADGSRAAHWEHTILITDTVSEILTAA